MLHSVGRRGASHGDTRLPCCQARGGVAGRGFMAYRYFCFFSAGFKICTQASAARALAGVQARANSPTQQRHPPPGGTWKENISVSSTLIMAPALSNSPQ